MVFRHEKYLQFPSHRTLKLGILKHFVKKKKSINSESKLHFSLEKSSPSPKVFLKLLKVVRLLCKGHVQSLARQHSHEKHWSSLQQNTEFRAAEL